MQFFRAIGSTVGVTLVGTFVTNTYVSNITTSPVSRNLSPQVLEAIQQPQNLLNKQLAGTLLPEVVSAVNQSLVDAMHHGFMISACFALLVAVLVIGFMPNLWIKTGKKGK
jgi:hypothetical protein